MPAYLDSVDDILSEVSNYFGIPTDIITSPTQRTAPVLRARFVATYLARKLTFKSMKSIATKMGYKDHTSVVWAFSHVALEVLARGQLRHDVHHIVDELSKKSGKDLSPHLPPQ